MRRRRLSNLLCGLSLLLCVVLGAAWLRSVLVYCDAVTWRQFDDANRRTRFVSVLSGGGCVALRYGASYPVDPVSDEQWAALRLYSRPPGLQYERNEHVSPGTQAAYGQPFRRRDYVAGFGWGREAGSGRQVYGRPPWPRVAGVAWMAGVPYWSLVLLAAAAPAWRMLRTRRRWRRARRGLCPSCGYDVRQTPDRCPECGRAPAADQSALATAARRHVVIFKVICLLALMGVATWATVSMHREAAERSERRRTSGPAALKPEPPRERGSVPATICSFSVYRTGLRHA